MFFDLPFVEQIDFSVLRHFVLGPAFIFFLTRPKHFMSRDHVLLTFDPLIRQADAKLKSPLETRQQILHVLAASCVKSGQFLASTLPLVI
jgi:hypothetical protein